MNEHINVWLKKEVMNEFISPILPLTRCCYPYIDVFVIMIENPFTQRGKRYLSWGRNKRPIDGYVIYAATTVDGRLLTQKFIATGSMSKDIDTHIDYVVRHLQDHAEETIKEAK